MAARQDTQSVSPDTPTWAGQDYMSAGTYDSSRGSSARKKKGNGSPTDTTSGGMGGMNFIKGIGGVQKKTTRDGQPAKRRGPKPDSKPAQTRRQELNRQAQRTHRERKEQYIKALEIEIARLREGYTSDVATMNDKMTAMNNSIEQHRMALREHQQENAILREILTARGIPFLTELESRKASLTMKPQPSSYGNNIGLAVSTSYNNSISATSSMPRYSPQTSQPDVSYGGRGANMLTPVTGTTHHSHSPADPGIFEQAISRRPTGVPDMPGVFEKDPNLQIEFILALEATCRDHGEYLIRRSVTSPDNADEALYSGHALMATAPPPTHISSVPAQQGGLVPTYPHQVPEIPAASLNVLLNLSNQIKAQGLVEGGQVTPIMALQSLRMHNRYNLLTRNDVLGMIEAIRNKVRCYGFGAVMEDFELRDALSNIFATKPETYEEAFGSDDVVETDDLY